MARQLFDTGIFSVIDEASSLGVGWLLNFYTAETTVRITTYTTPSGSVQNTNPVVAQADGRFPQIWIDTGQSIKWILTDADGTVKVTVDDYTLVASPPTISAALYDFLAGNAPLPVANGGTASTSAVNALSALGAMGLAGGTFTGQILQSGHGAYIYNGDAGQASGLAALTADDASDPTTLAGQWWLKYPA
jgi:hypothetical protein